MLILLCIYIYINGIYINVYISISLYLQHVCDEITNAIKRGAKYTPITYKDKYNKSRYVGFEFNPPPRICSWGDFRLRDPSNNMTTSQSLSCVIVRVFFPLISVILPKWIALHQYDITDQLVYSPSMQSKHHDHHHHHHHHDIDQIDITQPDSPEIEYYSSEEKEDKQSEVLSDMMRMKKSNSTGSTVSNMTYQEFEQPINCAYKIFLVSGAGHALKKTSVYSQEDSTQQLSHLLCKFIRDCYPQITVTQFFSGQDIFHYLENIKFVHSTLRPAIDHERAKLATIHGKNWKKYFNLSLTLCDGTPARLSAIIEGLRSFEPDMLHMFRRKSLWTHYPNIEKLWDEDFEYLKFNQMETYPAIPITEIKEKMILNIINEMRKWKKDFLAGAVDDASSEMSRFWLRKTHQPVLAVLSTQKPNQLEPIYYRGCNVEVSMPTGSLCAERNAIGTAIASDPSLRREHFKAIAVLFLSELDKVNNNNNNNNDNDNNDKHTPHSSSFGMTRMNYAISAPLQRRQSIFEPETDDVNPRGPCGSCMEWLGKIAQCNPSFKVITFSSRAIEEAIVRNLH